MEIALKSKIELHMYHSKIFGELQSLTKYSYQPPGESVSICTMGASGKYFVQNDKNRIAGFEKAFFSWCKHSI